MLVVPRRCYPALCVKTSFVFAAGDNHRVIGLSPIARALSNVKLAALQAFQAFSGADITRRFSVKEELLRWKTFMDAENSTTALGSLGATVHPPRRELYQPGTGISQVKELRWHTCLFRKKSGQIG